MCFILIARTNSYRLQRSAFTLVEMLVAIAIFSILVVLTTGILLQLNRTWAQSEAQTQRQQSGRALLNFLAREIAKAMMPLNVTNQASLQFVINPSSMTSTSYSNHDNIFFQAPVATDSSAGEVAEVGYFVQWTGNTAQLCRFFVNPTDTTNYQIYANPTSWLKTTYLTDVASAASPNYQGLLAENVIGLWINAYDKSGNSVLNSSRSYDSRQTGNLPGEIDISILVLDPSTATRLASGAASMSSIQPLVQTAATTNAAQCLATLPAVLQPGASCFTTRVQLGVAQ